MDEFDRRWRECAARARNARWPEEDVPPGFAGAVLARRRAGTAPSAALAWERCSLRALAAVILILIVCVAVDARLSRKENALVPHVEDTIAKMFWML
jgi:hypothetical protein